MKVIFIPKSKFFQKNCSQGLATNLSISFANNNDIHQSKFETKLKKTTNFVPK